MGVAWQCRILAHPCPLHGLRYGILVRPAIWHAHHRPSKAWEFLKTWPLQYAYGRPSTGAIVAGPLMRHGVCQDTVTTLIFYN